MNSLFRISFFVVAAIASLVPFKFAAQTAEPTPSARAERPWVRHVIDRSLRGADGARFADVNGDCLPDVSVPWEESGVVRLYTHPGLSAVTDPWPAVTVGTVASPEDAVVVDVDGDGAPDVVSSCEGNDRTVYVHWNPNDPERLLDPSSWVTEPIPCTRQLQQWMFCLPFDVDGRGGTDLVVAGKGKGAAIGWLECPANPRNLADWNFHSIRSVGWIMSILAEDVDGDGTVDLVYSDRRGDASGVYWLTRTLSLGENGRVGVGDANRHPTRPMGWRRHLIAGRGREVMFMDFADLDGDGLKDVLAATIGADIIHAHRESLDPPLWSEMVIQMPKDAVRGKSIRVGDLNGDGRMDLVHSIEGASGISGVVWMRYPTKPTDRRWTEFDISGTEGIKFDLLQAIDLDRDGDLDVVTCEEHEGLGVVWYENPLHNAPPSR